MNQMSCYEVMKSQLEVKNRGGILEAIELEGFYLAHAGELIGIFSDKEGALNHMHNMKLFYAYDEERLSGTCEMLTLRETTMQVGCKVVNYIYLSSINGLARMAEELELEFYE